MNGNVSLKAMVSHKVITMEPWSKDTSLMAHGYSEHFTIANVKKEIWWTLKSKEDRASKKSFRPSKIQVAPPSVTALMSAQSNEGL